MKTISCMLILLFLCSCSIFQDFAVTVDKKKLVHDLAENGVYLALTTIYDKDDEIEKRIETARILKDDIFNNIAEILSNGSVEISEKTLNKIIEDIPEKMRPFLKSAFNMLKIARVDASGVIGKYPSTLVKEFCYGVIIGCNRIINDEEE